MPRSQAGSVTGASAVVGCVAWACACLRPCARDHGRGGTAPYARRSQLRGTNRRHCQGRGVQEEAASCGTSKRNLFFCLLSIMMGLVFFFSRVCIALAFCGSTRANFDPFGDPLAPGGCLKNEAAFSSVLPGKFGLSRVCAPQCVNEFEGQICDARDAGLNFCNLNEFFVGRPLPHNLPPDAYGDYLCGVRDYDFPGTSVRVVLWDLRENFLLLLFLCLALLSLHPPPSPVCD